MIHPPELTAAGLAVGKVRERYAMLVDCEATDDTSVVDTDRGTPYLTVCRGSREHCQQWIDCEAACAAFESVLPVGDKVLKAMLDAKPSHVLLAEPGCEEQFTAAIRAITGRDG